jgi:hypothetical protein
VCNDNGCVSCKNTTNRIVTMIKSVSGKTMYMCDCLPPLNSYNNGDCVCPFNCTCVNGNISCSN